MTYLLCITGFYAERPEKLFIFFYKHFMKYVLLPLILCVWNVRLIRNEWTNETREQTDLSKVTPGLLVRRETQTSQGMPWAFSSAASPVLHSREAALPTAPALSGVTAVAGSITNTWPVCALRCTHAHFCSFSVALWVQPFTHFTTDWALAIDFLKITFYSTHPTFLHAHHGDTFIFESVEDAGFRGPYLSTSSLASWA